MKKYRQYPAIIILIIVLSSHISCTKTVFNDSSSRMNFVDLFSDQSVGYGLDSNFHISVYAGFTDKITLRPQLIGGVAVNKRTLLPNSDSLYSIVYTDSSATTDEGKALTGTTVKVKINGTSSADTLTQEIYMPKNILRQTSDFPAGTVNASTFLPLTWVPDPNSPTKEMHIQLLYYSGLSQQNDPSLPGKINSLEYNVPDNGSYAIRATDLLVFPTNSVIGIHMARENQLQAVLPLSGKIVYFWALCSLSSDPLKVVR